MCYPERDTFVLNIVARGNACGGDEGRNKTSGMAAWWIYNAPLKPQTPREKQFLENNQRNDRALFSTPSDPGGETCPHTVTNSGGVKGSLKLRVNLTVIHHLPDCGCNHTLGRKTLNQLVSNPAENNNIWAMPHFVPVPFMICWLHP